MRAIQLISAVIFLLAGLSCGGDKKAQLGKLKKEHAALSEKIKALENSAPTEKNDPIDPSKFKYIGLTEVKTDVFDHYIRVQGKLDGDQNVAVFADIPGTISVRYADVGKRVSRGEVLAQIDDRQYRSQLESLETQYKFASDMYEKQKRLWDQKIGSEMQYLQAKTNKESLEQQISSLREQVEKFKIKSPVDGTIEECNIRAGSVVSPDPRSAAYRVVDFKDLKVSAEVSEAYAARVNVGDKLIILFPDLNYQILAKVDFVSRYINPVNRTFIIESRIPSETRFLKANMIAIIQINDYHSEKSIQIPMNLIQTDKEGSYVYVVRKKDDFDGAFKQRVVVGNTYNGVAEILHGLAVNDRVVLTGFQELINGEYVRF